MILMVSFGDIGGWEVIEGSPATVFGRTVASAVTWADFLRKERRDGIIGVAV